MLLVSSDTIAILAKLVPVSEIPSIARINGLYKIDGREALRAET
jgi:hypothetical protein